MNRFYRYVLPLVVVAVLALPSSAVLAQAQAAVVMEAATRRVLLERNADQLLYPASITKIVTALVAHENSLPSERVEIDASAVGVEGSSIWLENGEVLTVEELLYGLLLESGNDAAQALAVHVAGTAENFAALMTDRVRLAGAADVVFKNPHGLPDEEHVVTARAMALAAAELLEYPLLQQIVQTEAAAIPWNEHDWDRVLKNHNRLVGEGGVDGVKTGYTRAARHTFVASATRGGQQVLVVLLRTSRNGKFEEAKQLLDWAFDSHSWRKPPTDTAKLLVPVTGGREDVVEVGAELWPVPVAKDRPSELRTEYRLAECAVAPVASGQQLGEALVYAGEELVYRRPLTAQSAVAARRSWWQRLYDELRGFMQFR